MGKYKYIHFGDNVPKNIEHEYNKLCCKEHYLKEKDLAHGVVHISYDACLNNVPEPCREESTKSETVWNTRLKHLPSALSLLKDKFPLEYNLINDYFLSGRNFSMPELSEKYNLSLKKVEYRLKKIAVFHEENARFLG